MQLLLDEPTPVPSGALVDHRLQPAAESQRAADTTFAEQVLRESRDLLVDARNREQRASA
ncbi:MAG TPA: hypothetical protein VEF89_25730 [Solirubrobacteraceae bacterium]|nr:hypothetical protein [Solirubrobacteraceae bacterium]